MQVLIIRDIKSTLLYRNNKNQEEYPTYKRHEPSHNTDSRKPCTSKLASHRE